jgi:hypothetical protein
MRREFLIGPLEAIVPVPLGADVAIQSAIQRNGARIAPLDPGARVGELRWAELGRVVEREIRSNDLDATQS